MHRKLFSLSFIAVLSQLSLVCLSLSRKCVFVHVPSDMAYKKTQQETSTSVTTMYSAHRMKHLYLGASSAHTLSYTVFSLYHIGVVLAGTLTSEPT